MRDIIICVDELTNNKISGIPRYMIEIIKRIDELLENTEFQSNVYISYPAGRKIPLNNLKNIRALPLEGRGRFKTGVLVREAKKRNALLIYMGPSICMYKDAVVTLHDARPYENNNYDKRIDRIFSRLQSISLHIFRTSKIVTVSEYQKERLCRLLHINKKRVYVIGNGWEHISEIEATKDIYGKYPQLVGKQFFLAIGSVAKHKNYEWILAMARKYPEYNFVIAGGISKKTWNYDISNIKCENVIFLGYTSDEDCKALIEESVALLHPSKYEGFGIPPLEALSLNKKIIISNATCLPEIFGKSAVYFNPDDYDFDLMSALECKTSTMKAVLEEHSWDVEANKWLGLLNKLEKQNVDV